jgi:predicted ATP-binding protein involved in virulence
LQKIEFTNNFFIKEKLNVTDGFCIILGNNCSGKTSILNTLENGFKGKLIDFLVDENPVKSDSYQVVFLNENSFLKENLKLTKNSFLKQLFGLKLNQEK